MKDLALKHTHQLQMKSSKSDMQTVSVIDVSSTINSGQVFLWEKIGDSWYGVDGQNIRKIEESQGKIATSKENYDFFRENDDFAKIFREISRDKVVRDAVKRYPGLRLVQQDPFQCYISFIVSSNSSITNIKNSLKRLCKKFGEKIILDDIEFSLFPTSSILSKAKLEQLLECGLGYRAKFVKEASKATELGQIDFESLKKSSYEDAKSKLLEIPGIGNKVADCIMLFSLDKLESFPLDRWMLRVLKKYYQDKFEINGTLTDKKYNELHEKIVNYFGCFAGYSQQFLFKTERELNGKKWL